MTAKPTGDRPPEDLPGEVDVVVVGAGIVGLATAYKIVLASPGTTVAVVEKESGPALHQTGRNSGVLHSGIYYKPGSLKAVTAGVGRAEMVEFCRTHDIRHDICGKVIVATSADELPRLDELNRRARANGVAAERIGPERLAEIEPHAAGIAALHVPETGIVNYTEVCEALTGELAARGVEVVYDAGVRSVTVAGERVRLITAAGDIEAGLMVNCAGLRSDQVAGMDPTVETDTHIVPFRGEYFELAEERRHLVKGLIYPVPDPSFPFLGVHLTRMVDGGVHAGPNAVLALAREGYTWTDVDLGQLRESLTDRGLWHLARLYWRTGAGEIWRSLNKAAFVKALQRLVPEIESSDLARSPAGVRAQALTSRGDLVDDFALVDGPASVHVLNAPSPAATASLRIGSTIAERVMEHIGP
ncbi:MAG TPA: L-2-hydroxyglutarate oxidase [Acidimicrobiales bacterium]|nr:L-2-hydroxyglutarate oxidase [Acidimicrobiales bacterium]